MSVTVSKRMARVKPSPTSAVVALAAELRAAGRNIISLGAGEPDFPTPEHIREAGKQAIDCGQTRYTPVDGTMDLKLAIQKKFARDNSLHYDPAQILVSGGAKQSCFNACQAILGPGDEAIVPAPYWVSYPDMVRLAEAEPVIIDTDIDSGFRISPQQLEKAITPRTRFLFLNSPSNPTGACYSRRQLTELGEVLKEHPDIVIAADDALFGHSAFRYVGWAARQWQWATMMGLRNFMEMVFTGRPFTAQEMKACSFVNSVVPREQLEAETMKYALACARNRPTDTVVLQKTFFEVFKQSQGEYMGSVLAGWLEGMLPLVKEEGGIAVDGETFEKGLAAAVKDNDSRFPPEWRLSYKGRAQKT